MAQFVWRREPTQVFQTAGVATGGTAVYTLPTDAAGNIDQMWRVRVMAFVTAAAAGHLANGAALVAECVTINKNGTVTFNTAIATSLNPINSNSAGFALTSRPETADAAVGTSTVVLTIAANVLTITVTNNAAAGGVTADISCFVDVDRTGSQ